MPSNFSKVILCAILLAFVGGCSSYPLPEDVIDLDSDGIASIVRCQTRNALREVVIDSILAAHTLTVYKGQTKFELADNLRNDPSLFNHLDWMAFDKELRDTFIFYKDTSISYDFTIDSMEMNTAGVAVGLLRQLPIGSNTIGLTARNDRTREVRRHFRVFDSFDSLARLLPDSACAAFMPTRVNYVYPIAGLIKIRSLVRSFLAANQYGNLAGDNMDYNTAQMTDTITFTTKNTGNVDPTLVRNPVLNAVVPANLAINVDNSRQDMHTIIILLRLPAVKTGLPRFDEIGRLTLPKKEAQRAVASDALDRQRTFNTQDALTQISMGISKTVP